MGQCLEADLPPSKLVAVASHAGDAKAVGDGVSEMRIDCGPGYRVYFIRTENVVIVLLAGGDKRSQSTDIRTAIRLARNL
ncbi:MAG TPA: type II toxin-antitoxin system RelE/ParE family toxin [Rhodothermia bacterium]|nr:type II toxin-antitoxin system RelE/ParE family toxin [Rhodothermia bacterium]